MTRRSFLASTLAAPLLPVLAANRTWPLGINTYCLRFERWDDRQLIDYSTKHKLDAIFLQDSLDPDVMNPKHWADVRRWCKEAGLHLETGGSAFLPKNAETYASTVAAFRKNIERASGMGSPLVRTLLASDRYAMPPGPVEKHLETALKVLREVRSQAMDANVKIAIENHKDLQAWQTRELIETAGKDFVGSYLDTGNPVFVAEHPMTTLEELGPLALCFHLRDSVVYEVPFGIAVQWVPLGEGTVDFKALVARAAQLLAPNTHVYCKPITARPPVLIPVYTDEFWNKWFPRGRSRDFERFIRLAKSGTPYSRPQVVEDVPEERERYMEALKIQQLEHMERSLKYCRDELNLGIRSRS